MKESKNIGIHKDFNKLFNKKESITLLGNKNINLWILGLILFVTFVAIGFANGSRSYLRVKMSDPYVNWVNIELDQAASDKSASILEKCNIDSVRDKYDIISTGGYNIFWLNFSDYADINMVQTEIGRTIEFNDTLLDKIVDGKMKRLGLVDHGFTSENDFGIIVTKEVLEKYHYPITAKYINHYFPYEGANGEVVRQLPIPILAVTESLPGNSGFISLPIFYYNRSKITTGDNPFIVDSETTLLLFVNDKSKEKASAIADTIIKLFQKDSFYKDYDPYAVLVESIAFPSFYYIKISFDPLPDNVYFVDDAYDFLKYKGIFEKYNNIQRFYDIGSRLKTNLVYDYHAIAINFQELNKIRDFAKFMAAENNVKIDIAQIEAKENYSFVARLTKIISLILIGFSILSICLFLSNLLRNHLEKISMNIGTFKAFGLDSRTLQKIYLKVIYRVIVGAMAMAIFAGWLFGKIGGMRLFLMMFGSDSLEKGEDYFTLFDEWTLISILLILLISFIVLRFTARRILRKSPGDLIYNR